MRYQKIVFPNKLSLILVPMDVESVTAMILVSAGSRYERKEISGLSHFLEHMAFKGTQKRPSAQELSNLLDGFGSEFNAFTGKETTGFYIKSASEHLPLALDVLSDIILNSKFDQEEIEKERGVILEEINLYEDTPLQKISDIYEELLYDGHSLGQDTLGNPKVIKSLQRKDFVSYLNSLYSPRNMTVVIAGGFKKSQVKSLVEKYFAIMKPFNTLGYEKIKEKQTRPQLKLKFKKTEQAHLCLGVRTYPLTHPDRYVLLVLATILGGGMSSRLFWELREKRGLGYYIRSTSEQFLDCGTLVTQAGIDLHRIDDGIKVIIEEYRKLKVKNSKFKVKNEELRKAKEYLKGHLVLELENSRAVAGFFGSQEILEREVLTPDQVIKRIEKITVDDLKRVAEDIFVDEKLNLALIGPFEDGQRFGKLLKL